MKKIGVVTGTRAEFGLLLLTLQKITQSKNLNLFLYVTGLHLLPKFGNTIDEVRKYDFPNIRIIRMYDKTKSSGEAGYFGYSISKALKEFVASFSVDRPDIVLLTGDRAEMLAAGVAAVSLEIPIAHIHGGDVAENAQMDEQIRHAITKFSHLHFTATELSRSRVLQMGEEVWRVFNVGSPDLDCIYNSELYSKEELFKQLGIPPLKENDEFILCVQHPNIADAKKSGGYMSETIATLVKLNKPVVLIYPNNDPGSELIIVEIEKIANNPLFHISKNLGRKTYLSAMKYALFMIGNSSSGIIESAAFHLPVVNIGIRNLNRECSENVINVKNGFSQIWEGIQKAMKPDFREFCKTVKNKYGNGTASDRIVSILGEITVDRKLLDKKFVIR